MDVCKQFDWIGVNTFLYWDIVWGDPTGCTDPSTGSPARMMQDYNQAVSLFPGIPIIISEVGWPSNGVPLPSYPFDDCLDTVVSETMQEQVIIATINTLKQQQVPGFLFTSFSNGMWKIP